MSRGRVRDRDLVRKSSGRNQIPGPEGKQGASSVVWVTRETGQVCESLRGPSGPDNSTVRKHSKIHCYIHHTLKPYSAIAHIKKKKKKPV